MRKVLSFSGMLVAATAAWSCADQPAAGPAGTASFGRATTGNGAPSGGHYNLNIIGVPKDKSAAMDDNNGRRIFVQLWGGQTASSLNNTLFKDINKVNKIFLFPAPAGESFNVLDANATDANGASFQLPVDVSTTYTVYARALGKPGGKADMTTCAVEAGVDLILGTVDDEVICSISTLSVTREKNSKFANVSAELLFITVVVDPITDVGLAACLGTTGQVTLPLFHSCLENYFWNYDNKGLKLLSLRFYPI